MHGGLEPFEELPRDVQGVLVCRVVDPAPLPAAFQQAGLTENREVLGDLGLAVRQRLVKVADADRPASGDVRNKLQAEWMTEGAEHFERDVARVRHDARLGNQRLRLRDRQLAESLPRIGHGVQSTGARIIDNTALTYAEIRI